MTVRKRKLGGVAKIAATDISTAVVRDSLRHIKIFLKIKTSKTQPYPHNSTDTVFQQPISISNCSLKKELLYQCKNILQQSNIRVVVGGGKHGVFDEVFAG